MEIEPGTFKIISLGCPKNLVDSEVMAGKLLAAGWTMVPDGPCRVCIVNTCSFVEDAAQESTDILLEHAEQKAQGQYEFLIATGCLPEKYSKEIRDAVAGVDAEIGTEDFHQIVSIVDRLISGQGPFEYYSKQSYLYNDNTARVLSGPPWRAYLKLAEGCDNHCSYCIIGKLRGRFRSRNIDSVIAEAQNLASMGVVELNLVAQDVTFFGADKPGSPGLDRLLFELNKIEPLKWIRLLYAHPAHLTVKMLEAMGQAGKVVPYLDLPLQHASDKILKSANRKVTKSRIETLITKARRVMPDIVFRTSFILGLPGETEDDFQELIDFVERHRFANLGAFAYSPEEGTPAFSHPVQIPREIAEQRRAMLMEKQQEIAREIWQGMIGTKISVLVEEELHAESDEDFTHIGRYYGQAPEIDGITYLRANRDVLPGTFVDAEIIDSTEYDLFAREDSKST